MCELRPSERAVLPQSFQKSVPVESKINQEEQDVWEERTQESRQPNPAGARASPEQLLRDSLESKDQADSHPPTYSKAN